MNSRLFLFGYLCLMIGLVLFFEIQAKHLVYSVCQKGEPEWMNRLVTLVYPRFEVEKQRYEAVFFVDKARQVVWRFSIVSVCLLLGWYFWKGNIAFRYQLAQYWDRSLTHRQVNQIRIGYVLIFTFCIYDWLWLFQYLTDFSVFYEPIFLLKILHLGFPSPFVLLCLNGVLWINLILILWNRFAWQNALISAIIFILLQAYLFSFHKLDHTYATFTYCVVLMPLLLWQFQKSRLAQKKWVEGWAFWGMQVMIVSAYFLAGLEKILISGWNWFSLENLSGYLYDHQSPYGIWLSQYPFVCAILSGAVVLFELAFPCLLIFPQTRSLFLLMGVLFHWNNYIFLNVGGLLTPWIFVYFFLVFEGVDIGKKGQVR